MFLEGMFSFIVCRKWVLAGDRRTADKVIAKIYINIQTQILKNRAIQNLGQVWPLGCQQFQKVNFTTALIDP